MGTELRRYLWWWVDDHKSSRLILTLPLYFLAGPLAVVMGALQLDFEAVLLGVVICLMGLFFLFFDFLRPYPNKLEAPWNKPPFA
jgi:hypothetical protein